MRRLISLIAVGVMLSCNSLVFATTITFDELSNSFSGSSIDYAEVTFTYTGGASGNQLHAYDAGSALPPLSYITIIGDNSHQSGEWYVATFKPGVIVKSVSVDMGDYNADRDDLVLNAYDSLNNLIGSATDFLPETLTGGKTLSVNTSVAISYVKYNGFGQYPGSLYMDNFIYTGTSAVSEPMTLLLLGLGLTGLAGARRFRN